MTTELLEVITKGSLHEQRKLVCPDTGHGFTAEFIDGDRTSLNATCDNLCCVLRLDGVEEMPPWVSEGGGKVRTGNLDNECR